MKRLSLIANCGLRIVVILAVIFLGLVSFVEGQSTKVGLSEEGTLVWSPAFKTLEGGDFDAEGRLKPIWSHSYVPRLMTAGSQSILATDIPRAIYHFWIPDGSSVITSPMPARGFTNLIVDVVVVDCTSAYSADPIVDYATAAILADARTQPRPIFMTVGSATREFRALGSNLPFPASQTYFAARLPTYVSPESSILSTQYVHGPDASYMIPMATGALTWNGAGRQTFPIHEEFVMLAARVLGQGATVSIRMTFTGDPR